MNLNRITIGGRLTADVEERQTTTGIAIATATIAVDRPYSKAKKQELQESGQPTADFIRIKAFGQRADVLIKYTEKGSRIVVEGRLETGSYTNQKGDRVYTTDIIVDTTQIIDYRKQENSYTYTKSEVKNDDFIAGPYDESTIPF